MSREAGVGMLFNDPDVIKVADHGVDVGPHAGTLGGTIVYEGSYDGHLFNRGNMRPVQIKVEGAQQLEMAAAFGVR